MSKTDSDIELPGAHRLVRQGTFNLKLLGSVRVHGADWRSSEDPDLGAVVSAEVYDYYGLYDEAEEALSAYKQEELLRDLAESTQDFALTRRLWLALAFAQIHYRAERYRDARQILEACLRKLDAIDSIRVRHLGTRARVQFALGQAQRQLGQYEMAFGHYTESIRLSQERFRKRTPKAEYSDSDTWEGPILEGTDRADFDDTQKLAHWNIARCLVLGTGWINYVTGRLTDASIQLNTCATLLRTTQDSVHRAYCQLLMAGVERARHTSDSVSIEHAMNAMKNAALGLSDHPLFRNRAHHELAVAYLHLKDLERAELEINTLDRLAVSGSGTKARATRWKCYSRILRSRLTLRKGLLDEAVQYARDARELARNHETNLEHCEIEALIALAEALRLRNQGADLEHAVEHFSEARFLSSSNPKSAAVCTVHLAAVFADLGHYDRAKSEMNRWHFEYERAVEHGFVRRLAEETNLRIWPNKEAFVVTGDNIDDNVLCLKKFLYERVRQGGTSVDHATRLFKGSREAQRKALKRLLKEIAPLARDQPT